ncbi:MAG: SWIM zinc finger family protein [Rhodococcus sp. (in: high G+C Gram-positive bacteria)]
MAQFDQFGPRRRISDGIAAKNSRGTFGSTWWGKQFVKTVEEIADAGRLSRGRTYARGGQVISLALRPGRIDGDVQGSQVEPFSASVTIAVLDPYDLDELMSMVKDSPGMLTELASGSVPLALGPRLLLSSASQLDFDCTCPDSGWPCKHAAALTYLAAEQIDEDPTRLLALRGIDLDALVGFVEDAEQTVDPDDHFGDRTVLPALPDPPFVPAVDDLEASLLRVALRTADVDEREIRSAIFEMDALYRRMGGA